MSGTVPSSGSDAATPASRVSYQLVVRVEYMRRSSMSSLLFSLAHKALREEANGAAWEQVHCHLTGDADYMGIAVIDAGERAEAGE